MASRRAVVRSGSACWAVEIANVQYHDLGHAQVACRPSACAQHSNSALASSVGVRGALLRSTPAGRRAIALVSPRSRSNLFTSRLMSLSQHQPKQSLQRSKQHRQSRSYLRRLATRSPRPPQRRRRLDAHPGGNLPDACRAFPGTVSFPPARCALMDGSVDVRWRWPVRALRPFSSAFRVSEFSFERA